MFGQLWELKKMYDKYKVLQDKLKKLVIRAKEGSYVDANGESVEWSVVIDITWEMKVRDVQINDITLLSPDKKEELQDLIKASFVKAQWKAQEVVQQKTKEILGFDPSDLAWMMWGWGMPKIPWMGG